MLHKHELLCVKIQRKQQTVSVCCKPSMCLYFSIYSRPCEEEVCKQLRVPRGPAFLTAAPRSPDPQVTGKPRLNQKVFPSKEHSLGNVRGRWELEQRARPGNCCQLWYVDTGDGRRLESCSMSSGL